MDIKQNATLIVKKGENDHVYHVPPTASLPEVYESLREMVAYVYSRLKEDYEKMQADKVPVAEVPQVPADAQAEAVAQPTQG